MNIYGFGFNDDVNYVDLTQLGWTSYGFGSNIILVPASAKMLVEGKMSYSKYDVSQEDFGEEANHSSIDGFSIGLDFSYFISKQHEIEIWGRSFRLYY